MTFYVLFCEDLMVNVENSLVRTFKLFPKQFTFSPRYGPFILGNTLISDNCSLRERPYACTVNPSAN